MGLRYLGGRSWADITREERFFCAHLFTLIRQRGVVAFVKHLNDRHKAESDLAAEWEIAYEACFYRDLWQHRGRKGVLFSPKRTFDLCLLSDDAIVIIEAKAHQEFDEQQLAVFERDKERLKTETGVGRVLLAALASSRYMPPDRVRAFFNGPYLTWWEMAELYDDDPILKRADAIYEPAPGWQIGKNNTDGYMTGAELLEAAGRGEVFFVGRDGGLMGPALTEDIASLRWRQQKYETNRQAVEPPNRNWFTLSDFARLVQSALGEAQS